MHVHICRIYIAAGEIVCTCIRSSCALVTVRQLQVQVHARYREVHSPRKVAM